ncbi:Flp family type IVb pilin [Vibrio astriarenae]|uniref:Flp family type IVb pilin n=1 Tax=Vibrio astriarenae TaxID=1481923 RepID=A0A7Z2YG65_9VIBR|nr:Flp family type IVb pilin [Vibrio astriarenae]QIA65825.1 Flp family type IVb pilin [Vibrio astriarenae]
MYCRIREQCSIAWSDQRGVTTIEYAIIGVVMSIIVLAVFNQNSEIINALESAFQAITNNIQSA